MPLTQSSTQTDFEDRVFRDMLRQAKHKVLFVSPPYSNTNEQDAFLTGYETALRDISRGHLTDPRST